MTAITRLAILLVVAQGCVPFRKGWPDAIDRSPCFLYVDTPLPLGAAPPRRAYIRLQNHRGDLPGGNALAFYRDSALTQRTQDGTWVSSGRDTLRLEYWSVPTTVVTLRRQGPDRWTGDITYGGDAIANGVPAIGHSQIDVIPYRCPPPA